MDERLRELERAAAGGDPGAAGALLEAWRRAGRTAVDVARLAGLGLTFAWVPAGEHVVGHDAVVTCQAVFGQTLARVAPRARVTTTGFFVAKEPLRLSHWLNLAPLLEPRLGDAFQRVADEAGERVRTAPVVTVQPSDGALQAEPDARPTTLPQQVELDPAVEVDEAKAVAAVAALGAALPRWTEWEVATRGREGRLYPWGDAFEREQLALELRDYSIDEESTMGYYSYDQDVWFVHSFGPHARQPSPFGLLGLARAGCEWNACDDARPDPACAHVLRSLSDLGDMRRMVPGLRPGTWGGGRWGGAPLALLFSGPALPCWAPPAPGVDRGAVRLTIR